MPRWMGVDYGSRRIGLAISDYGGSIASPAAVLRGTGSLHGDARQIIAWARENDASGIVVGLPLNMDGTTGPQAAISRKIAAHLAQAVPDRPVELWDERLSSFQADANLEAAGTRPGRRRDLRDALAAQVILQAFLDSRRPPAPQGA